jgi:hypothetical protein
MTLFEVAAVVSGGAVLTVPLVYLIGWSFSRGFHNAKRRFVRDLITDTTERKE